MLERRFASRLAPPGALAEATALAMVVVMGNPAGRPAVSSRDLKMLLQRGSRLPCWSAALHRDWRRRAPPGAPAEAVALAVIANMGNTAGRLAPPVVS
ncbi:hypothetical protein DU490_16180 [Halomonas sp. DQ26W]|nr:hypothetical protein DU490_16180 [Halomonas sp. DQ26W]